MNLDEKIKGIPKDLFDLKLSSKKETLFGKGTIYMAIDGKLELKFFDDSPKEDAILEFFKSFNEARANVGKLIPDESYYSLEGVATNGDHYFCHRIFLKDHDNFKVYTCSIDSDLIISKDNSAEIYTAAKIEIPYRIKNPSNRITETQKKYSDKWTSQSVSLDIFEIQISEGTIDIYTTTDSTIILIQSKDKENLETIIPTIIQTLGFITATVIDRYAIEFTNRSGSKRLFRYFRKQKNSINKGLPPLNISDGSREDFAELFSRFYNFIKNNSKSDSIIQTRARIIDSKKSYLMNYALALCTSIETIIIDHLSTGVMPTLKEELTFAKEQINKTEISVSLKKRIIGMLANILGQVRADEILNELVAKGLIRKKLFTDWKKLRNPVTHGKQPTDDDQEYNDLCQSALVLYYSLLFILIEYKGHYTDYSSAGFPMVLI
jgi:hypothetical protein